ncbi:MAG: protein-methionine-sulfoxide reductase catalytic subunit MsrP [Rhodospirillales bacterium]|nr:protein-methionine-sulfoxide reductase catalytic subunit MsrP [Rhodospirillales bacterium]
MMIKRRHQSDVRSSEITPKDVYMERRRFMAAGAGALLFGAVGATPAAAARTKLDGVVQGLYQADEEWTPYDDITSYNNFYEFGTGKDDPIRYSRFFNPSPWSVTIDGAVEKPGTYTIEDILKPHALEERVYRLRCVERWSMVVPWVGFPLADLLKRFAPTSGAKYVAFETLLDPERMPGQKLGVLEWPYVEGLTIDEAMHPLTLLAVGLYGETMPNQNGAPLRLVVPWKYGFKSIKSIVRISLVEKQPPTSWNISTPREYGFYSNVNPEVDHPRWTQATERRIGDFFRRPTLMFNGYAEDVANLYAGMDLVKNY